MSVVVKGMEMPDHCWECWLMRNMICGACGEMIPVTGKRNHCPLVALPDKHGRLVDADALIGALHNHAFLEGDDRSICYNIIQRQPTIEPQRKKGRWIKKTIKKKIENDYSCSECGRHVSVMRGYDVRMVYPFCHCGADMTEGEG